MKTVFKFKMNERKQDKHQWDSYQTTQMNQNWHVVIVKSVTSWFSKWQSSYTVWIKICFINLNYMVQLVCSVQMIDWLMFNTTFNTILLFHGSQFLFGEEANKDQRPSVWKLTILVNEGWCWVYLLFARIGTYNLSVDCLIIQ